jgi:hypothetical protein
MKSIIIVSIFLFQANILFGQHAFIAVPSLDRNNVIYTSLYNSFTIDSNVEFSDIDCSINNNGIIEKQSSRRYTIRVSEVGYYTVTLKQKSTGQWVSYTLRAKKLPIPTANIENAFGDSVSNLQLKQAKELKLSYPATFDYNISAEIISFKVLKISKENKRSELNNFTSILSNETKELLKFSEAGDIFIFKSITAKGPDPGILNVQDLILYIK